MSIWEKTKVLIVNDDHSKLVSEMFEDKGCKVTTITTGMSYIPKFIEQFDIIVLTGGTDISPFIYCSERDNRTDLSDCKRDAFEISIIQAGIKAGVGIVGICRGGQLLCAHLGGCLQQHDMSGYHIGGHNIILSESINGVNMLIDFSANHHQLMLPPKTMNVIGYAGDHCEIAVHLSYGVLAFQPHPEWEHEESINQQTFFEMVKEYCI